MKQAATYAYVFGPHAAFHPLVEASSHHALVASHGAAEGPFHTESHGLVTSHDGSVSDYCLRRGSRWVATLETTTVTSLSACHQVNLIWIRGFIERAAL